MQDRFKFRSYNKELRKMYEVDTICPYEDNHTKGGEVFLKGIQYNSFYFPEEVELMQSTGLKDKNGKLIYEGDVVKVDKNTYADSFLLEQFENENAMITYREELGRYNIEFMPKDNSGSNVMDLMADFYYFLKWKPCGKLEYGILEYIEVIGNIYENKDLLNENS